MRLSLKGGRQVCCAYLHAAGVCKVIVILASEPGAPVRFSYYGAWPIEPVWWCVMSLCPCTMHAAQNDEGGHVIKAAFFDVDGTLLSFATHEMPVSTKEAIRSMREQGILTIVASGRAFYQLPSCLRSGFDAYITLNGQLCFDDRGVFRSNPIDPADVRVMVDQAAQGLYDILVMQRDRAFVSSFSESVCAIMKQSGVTYELDELDRAFDAPVYQFCAFLDPGEERIFMDATKAVKQTRWSPWFCDVVPAAGGKSYGIQAVFERYGIAPEEAVAFGDGENDLSMFEMVGTSVAMGNASDMVKAHATLVTDDVDSDGLYNACKKLGLLS